MTPDLGSHAVRRKARARAPENTVRRRADPFLGKMVAMDATPNNQVPLIFPCNGKTPRIHRSAWIAPGAVIIGDVAFGKVFINFALKLLAVSIGAVIYYIVLQIVLQLGLNTNDLKLVSALIVAVFLAIPYWKGHIHTKKGGSVHA